MHCHVTEVKCIFINLCKHERKYLKWNPKWVWPVSFELRFSNPVDLKDLNHCHSSSQETWEQKNPFGALTTFSVLKFSK